MTLSEKHIVTALTISSVVVAINIIAVTSGTADSFYIGIKEWIDNTLLLPPLNG